MILALTNQLNSEEEKWMKELVLAAQPQLFLFQNKNTKSELIVGHIVAYASN